MRPPIPSSHKYFSEKSKDVSFEVFKDLVYNTNNFKKELKVWDKETYENTFDALLEKMYKLTQLSDTLLSYDEKEKLCFVTPEFNEHQQFRCYFTKTYVAVEINSNPTNTSSNWTHIIENHGADEKDKERFYEIKIMPNLSEEVWKIVLVGVSMCVETVEHYLHGLVNNQKPIYEQMKLIRIGEPTEEEMKKAAKIQAWANREVLKEEKKLNMAAKMEKRKQFWNNVFGIKNKVLFK